MSKVKLNKSTFQVVLAGLLILGFFVVTYSVIVYLQKKDKSSPEEIEVLKVEDGMLSIDNTFVAIELEEIVVKLADTDEPCRLQVKVVLMFDDRTTLKEISESNSLRREVNDVIIQTLSKKTSRELLTEEDIEISRSEVYESIKFRFKDFRLSDVFFAKFNLLF